jgi:4-hydroxybenzoate polyprenyltransferase
MGISLERYTKTFFLSNYFIALCTACMILATQLMNGLPLRFTPYLVFLTASSFLLYNFHRYSFYMDFSAMKNLLASIKKLRIRKHEVFIYFCAVIISVSSFLFLESKLQLFLIPLMVLSLAYSIPVLKVGIKKLKLREIFFIKTPLLAIVWGVAITSVPITEQNISPFSSFAILQLLCNCLFIFCLCIPFELRDVQIDKMKKIKTLPVIIGNYNFIMIGIVFTVIQLVVHHLLFSDKLLVSLSLDLSALVALAWIIIQDKSRGMYFYKFLVDGTMILRFLLIFTAVNL